MHKHLHLEKITRNSLTKHRIITPNIRTIRIITISIALTCFFNIMSRNTVCLFYEVGTNENNEHVMNIIHYYLSFLFSFSGVYQQIMIYDISKLNYLADGIVSNNRSFRIFTTCFMWSWPF